MDNCNLIRSRGWRFSTPVALLVGAAFFLLGCDRGHESGRQAPTGRNILISDVAGGKVDLQLIDSISWKDVVSTAEGVSSDKAFSRKIIEATKTARRPATLYLRGMLLLAVNDAKAAQATFAAIPPAEIPVALLYAPYRLHNGIRPDQSNPFLPAMTRTVEQGQVQPLIQARVWAVEGQTEKALKAYLQTDPAEWTTQDVAHLRVVRFQAGLANDTAVMLQAALKAGRVRQNLRGELIGILNAPRDKAALEEMKAQLVHQIQTDPNTRAAAIASANQQLLIRKQFLEKKYRELLDQHRHRPAVDLPDETVLMLVLSAAQLHEAAALELWAQEMKRRYPTPEVEKWIRELHAPSR